MLLFIHVLYASARYINVMLHSRCLCFAHFPDIHTYIETRTNILNPLEFLIPIWLNVNHVERRKKSKKKRLLVTVCFYISTELRQMDIFNDFVFIVGLQIMVQSQYVSCLCILLHMYHSHRAPLICLYVAHL